VIIFDIGANTGESTIHYCLEPTNELYVFEPTPWLCEKYLNLKAQQYKNYHVINKAISDYNGKSLFNIAEHDEGGVSSFYNFTDNIENLWKDSKHGTCHRSDFYFEKTIEVEVIRMDTFIEQNNISAIDFCHCDAQGNDFKILNSFGKYIDIVKSGEVESPRPDAPMALYKNTTNSFDSIMNFLKEHGFTKISWEPNGIFKECLFECNISFSRS
jgi:FkbM family methyltransferase